MKKITFDEEEMFVIAVFNPDTRSNTIHIMSEVLPELKDDQDMFDLLLSAMEKLKRISDDEYKKMDLTEYRDEIEWAIEEEWISRITVMKSNGLSKRRGRRIPRKKGCRRSRGSLINLRSKRSLILHMMIKAWRKMNERQGEPVCDLSPQT